MRNLVDQITRIVEQAPIIGQKKENNASEEL